MISKSVNQFLKLNLKNECSVNSVSLSMVKLVKNIDSFVIDFRNTL